MSKVCLETYLERSRTWHRFITKPETVHTSDAARVAGISLVRVTKNLISQTSSGEFVVLIVPGDSKVNLEAAAKALDVHSVTLVPFSEAESISGYPPGGTPSIGHKSKMRCVIDSSLLQYDTIYCGGGGRDRLLELKTPDVIRINNAIVADISVKV